jgi:hypothetical protein
VIAETIDAMLADVAFKAPVTEDDCKAVYSALKEALQASNPKVEVYCNADLVYINVYVNGSHPFMRKVKVS